MSLYAPRVLTLAESLSGLGLDHQSVGAAEEDTKPETGAPAEGQSPEEAAIEEARRRVQRKAGGKVGVVKLHRGSSADRAASRRSKMKHKGTQKAYMRKMKKLSAAGRMTKAQKSVSRFKAARGMGESLLNMPALFLEEAIDQLGEAPSQMEELRLLAAEPLTLNADLVATFANVALYGENLSGQYTALAESIGFVDFWETAEVLQGLAQEAATVATAFNKLLSEGKADTADITSTAQLLREHMVVLTHSALALEKFDETADALIAEVDAIPDEDVVMEGSDEGSDEDEDEDEDEDDEEDEEDEEDA